MMKTRRKKWTGHVARMGEEDCRTGGKARRKETTRKT
jgi:hypothetical protein